MPLLDSFAALYGQPQRLEAGFAHERIFAPRAYATVRRLSIVPIVHVEALALAAWFPVCWRLMPSGPELCILRSLLPDAEASGPGSVLRRPTALPLALRSYPVAVHPMLGENGAVYIDRAIADEPTDAGAPMALADGRPSRGLTQRFRSALIARHSAPATEAMTAALAEADAFRPWSIEYADASGTVPVEGFLHAPAEFGGTPQGRRLLGRFGVELAALLTAHRLSLFRFADLRRAAERSVREPLSIGEAA